MLKEFEVKIEEENVTENQIKLSSTAEGIVDIKWATQPRRNLKTQSYKVDGENFVKVYVPETVCEDLADLDGEYVTFILGEDNIAVAILVDEDSSAQDYLTAYDSTNGKITVGGEKYKLSKTAVTVTLNGTTKDSSDANWTLEEALKTLGVTSDYDDIEKVIDATLTLDDEGDVKTLELFASFDEVIVTEINETGKRYEIKTTGEDIEWKLEEEEEGDLDFPKVFIDGAKGDIRDIAVGNVLTILTAGSQSEINYDSTPISKIYVSTETVTGEVTKVTKATKAVKIDGTSYLPTADGKTYETQDKEIEEAIWANTFTSKDILDNENVTLFLNIFGEYVGVWYTEAASDYQYGVVTAIVGPTTSVDWEEIDGEDYATKGIRVLLANGDIERFTLKTKADDSNYLDDQGLLDLFDTDKIEVGTPIMFKADSNKAIMLGKKDNSGNIDEIQTLADDSDNLVAKVAKNAELSGKKFTLTDGPEVTYTSNTVIFNYHVDGITNKVTKEVVTDWNSIIANKKLSLVDAGDVVYDKDTKKVLYMFVDSAYTSSDYELAVVDSKLDEIREDKWIIDFVDEKEVAVDADFATSSSELTDKEGWLVKYTTKGGEIDDALALIDLLTERDDEDAIASYIKGGTKFDLVSELKKDNINFAQLEVKEVYVDDEYVDITFGKNGDKKVSNAQYELDNGTYYTLANDVYTPVANKAKFDAEKTYYAVKESKDDAYDDKATYYTKADGVYTKVTTDISGTFDAEKHLLLEATVATLENVDCAIGRVELLDEADVDAPQKVKAYDLRDGDVEEFTLTTTENPGFSAVVYVDTTSTTKTSIVFIID